MAIERYEESTRHVIAALDVDTLEDALALASSLRGVVQRFKVGSKLFTRCGPKILDRLGEVGARVFLDLKYHDIPSVVGKACCEAARHPSVFMLTVHAVGGEAMIAEAVAGARRGREGGEPVSVIAVTVLTSHAQDEISALGVGCDLADWARLLGERAMAAGAAGLVCSAREVSAMRARHGDALLVTPGIRPGDYSKADDQTRVVTPPEALASGSDYLVIGRPIYLADDPRSAAIAIARSLA